MNGLQLLQTERTRHLVLGYNAAHDSTHTGGELAKAALARLLAAEFAGRRIGMCDFDLLVKFVSPWSSGVELYAQSRVRLLTEAGALVVAELERLLPPSAETTLDDRAYSAVAEAIGLFARSTGNAGRINNLATRRRALDLLRDYADHLVKQVQAEIDHLPQPNNVQEDASHGS